MPMASSSLNTRTDGEGKTGLQSTPSTESSRVGPVLIVSGVKGDTRRYRTFHLFQQFLSVNIDSHLTHITDPKILHMRVQPGAVVMHRVQMDRYVSRLITLTQTNKIPLLADIDDLTFNPQVYQYIASPDFQDTIRRRIYRDEMLRQRHVLETSDVIIASTDYLAEQATGLGKPVFVHRNAFSFEMLSLSQEANKQPKPDSDRIVIGYAGGTPTHNRDFATAAPALQAIMRHHLKVELVLIGPLDIGSGWETFAGRIHRLGLVPWRRLPFQLAKFDINLAPLVLDNPFSRSKSEIKYVEAGLVRVPTIASRTEAFRFAIHDGETGYLAEDSASWEEALEALVTSADLRQQMGASAYEDVLSRYHPSVRAHQLLETLDHISRLLGLAFPTPHRDTSGPITDTNDPINSPLRIPEAIERQPTLFRRGLYTVRYRGVVVFLGMAWVYFRRLISPIFPFRKESP